MGPEGLEVRVDDLAAQVIKGMAKREVASLIAKEVIKQYGDDFIREVAFSITQEEVRSYVISAITDRIIEKWRQDG